MKRWFFFLVILFFVGCGQTTTTQTTDTITSSTTTSSSTTTTSTSTVSSTTSTTTTVVTEPDPLLIELTNKVNSFYNRIYEEKKMSLSSRFDYLIYFNNNPNSVYSDEFLESNVIYDPNIGYLFNEFQNSSNSEFNQYQIVSVQNDKLYLNNRQNNVFTQEVLSDDVSPENLEMVISELFNLDEYLAYDLPNYGEVIKINEDYYYIRIELDDFLANDSLLAQALGFSPKMNPDDIVYVFFTIKFSENGFEYSITHDAYAIGQQHSSATYYLDLSISDNYVLGESINYVYPDRTKSFILFDNPEDCVFTYTYDMFFGISIPAEKTGYFRIYLDEGYYLIDGYDFSESGKSAVLLDEDYHEIDFGPTFYLENSGTYYVKIDHDFSPYFNSGFELKLIDFTDANNFLNPGNNLIGTLGKDETNTFLIFEEIDETVLVKITINSLNYVNLAAPNHTAAIPGEMATIYMIVEPGEVFMIEFKGLRNQSEYDVTWELVSIEPSYPFNLSLIPEISIDSTSVFLVAENTMEGYCKFEIESDGRYLFNFEEHPLNVLEFEIYNQQNLLIESGNYFDVFLETGIYYIKVTLYEDKDTLVRVTIEAIE